MKILGFHSYHDSSYSILEDGIPKIHVELERHIRKKNVIANSIKFFEKNESFNRDIEYIAINRYSGLSIDDHYKSLLGIERLVENNNGKLYITGHHQAHAANAFYSSDFSEAVIITIDGGGIDQKDGGFSKKEEIDKETNSSIKSALTIWYGKDNKIHPIKLIPATICNPGWYWFQVTQGIFDLGTWEDPRGDQAGSVMGMSALGKPNKFLKNFDNFINLKGEKNATFFPKDGLKLKEEVNKSEQNGFDIAASLQKATEEYLLSIITPYLNKYTTKNVCLSGGVSLNCVFTGKLYDNFSNIKVYCDPIPYDAGLSLGASRYVYHHVLDYPRIYNNPRNRTPYLGKKYGLNEIQNQLGLVKDKINYKSVIDEEVIDLMINEFNVISLYGGASESGRRALGNRSIVADPRNIKMKDIINSKVKHRQWFRPFAPSILREDVKDWFVHDIDSPYMSFTLKFKEGMAEKVPAVVHFDGTARLQTVKYEDNNWYYNFIKLFKAKTGIPMILNTSFNDREPIVETPEHAINCFLKTNIDYLYFRDFNILVTRN